MLDDNVYILSNLAIDKAIKLHNYLTSKWATQVRGTYSRGELGIGNGVIDDRTGISTISHETIHAVLVELFNEETSRQWDVLYYSHVDSLTETFSLDDREVI